MAAPADRVARAALHLRGYKSRHITTRGGRVHLLDAVGHGDLPPMLFLHGLGSAGVHFRPFLHKMRPHVRRLIVPDIPAHGFSDIPSAGPNMGTLGDGLLDALDRVLDEPVIVYGNSMGGFAAIRFALSRPDKVRALVLCSPGGAAMDQDGLDALLSLFRPLSHADALAFVDRLLTKRGRLRHLFALGARRRFTQDSLQDLIASIQLDELLERDQLQSLDAPILFMWGQEEKILPERSLAFFREHLPPHAKIIRPARFGHSPHLEYPTLLSNTVLEFLRAI